ncbi:hypothetical protein [Acinetobacter sp. Ac_5812]|uniref:hypothetical protein n=1 Tax=Acinetobacter sp. Ac_5812 TaxID=1848937 RepID=UPI00148FB9D0|nr:hypothetical protein [Acinetobacter sp. Ac_5812]NNP70453.1 hypothetical protein [Acinetobacter sp. Ac_5812]
MLKGIFSFTLTIWIIYVLWFFLFTNNAEDRIKNLELEEVVRGHFDENEQEYADKFLNYAEKNGAETNKSLTKSLKNLGAENFSLKEKVLMPQVKYISYKFEYKGYTITMGSKVAERNLIRKEYPGPLSKLLFIESLKCSNGRNEKITDMISLDNVTGLAIMSSFYTDPKLKAMDEVISYICPR